MKLHDLMIEGVRKILGEDGLLVRDGMMHSAAQLDYALRVAEGFTRKEPDEPNDSRTRLNILEAQTGTGKTIGYLVPLMLFSAYTGKRVMVSTFTRALQKQILQNDAQKVKTWVKEVTGSALFVARRVGRGNYVSPLRAKKTIDDLRGLELSGKDYSESIEFLNGLLSWCESEGETGSMVLDDYLASYGFESLPEDVLKSQITLDANSSDEEQAPYLRDVQISKQADLIIVNHTLLLMHAWRNSSMLDDLKEDGRRSAAIVVDEADRVPTAAESVMGADLTVHALSVLAADLAKKFPSLEPLEKAISDLHDQVSKCRPMDRNILTLVNGNLNTQGIAASLKAASELAKGRIRKVKKYRDRSVEENGSMDQLSLKLNRFLDGLGDMMRFSKAMDSHNNTAILSWSPVLSYASMRVGRPWPGRLLSRLWNEPGKVLDAEESEEEGEDLPENVPPEAILFTSATISTPGKTLPSAFDDFCTNVGAIRFPRKGSAMPIHRVQVDLFKRYEPVKFGQLSFVLADPRSPNPTLNQDDIENDLQWTTNPDWLDYAAKMIMKAGKSGERVLVLTLSYRDTVELAARLEAEGLKDRLLEHKKGVSIDTLSEQFAEANGAIMITPSGWEGLDMQGLVTNLVITRIPFMPPNSADVEILRAHLIAKRNAADKIEVILRSKQTNEARRKMAQGVGRALRSPTDVSTVWIADPRFPMPESMSHALHVAVMEAPKRLVQKKMVECIPRRFRNSAYQQAEVMLLTGERCRLR